MRILQPVVILISIIQWSLFQGVGIWAAPLEGGKDRANDLFPQQPWAPPEKIKDGQSLMDKIFIMKMINYLEWDMVKKRGLRKTYPYLREYIYEGDIILTRQQALSFVHPETRPQTRGRRRRRRKRKMDVHVLGDSPMKKWDFPIHYTIDPAHTPDGKRAILEAIHHWSEKTCIKFEEHPDPSGPYLHFVKGEGCYTFVGKVHDSAHPIFIKEACYTKGIISHEIGHSLGFWHEHAREDRDAYVNTKEENIIPGQDHNFQKISWAIIDNMAVQYDISSVMHYNALEFSVAADEGLTTIESRDPFLQNSMGQQLELSFYDVKLANKAYCQDVCIPADLHGVCKHDGYQDPRDCSRCRCPDGLSGDFCETVAPSIGDCGGVITLSNSDMQIIRSPGYPDNYPPGLKCYWLIKSPIGTSIRMKFEEPYMNSSYCIANRQYSPCTDFVEIRTNDNLGNTGGRFCCDDSFQRRRLSQNINSHTNHTLVLFKTMARGEHGFQVQLTMESCGGCYTSIDDKQRPCYRHVTSTYNQTWFVSENVTTYTNYPYPHVNTPYTRVEKVEKQRQSVESSEEPYCCDGYVLNTDNTSCIASSAPTTTKATTATVTESSAVSSTPSTTVQNLTPDTSDTSDTEGDGSLIGWSAWSPWTTCSVTCDGCGTDCGGCGGIQTRRRSYEGAESNMEDDVEPRECGMKPCDTGSLVQTCARNVTEIYSCGFFFTASSCTRTETEYYTQEQSCCCGYELKGDECVEKVT